MPAVVNGRGVTMTDGERWAAVRGWEGKYEVSDLGRVRQLPGLEVRGGRKHHRQQRLLHPYYTADGYFAVVLRLVEHGVGRFVQDLVADAFVPNAVEGDVVVHRNGLRHDNRAENLVWAPKPAASAAFANAMLLPTRSHCGFRDADVESLIRLREGGLTMGELASRFGISDCYVSKLLARAKKLR